ncbi:MAG: endo alpha-1,4 polygalactosaminidase [Planctomycetes bacterium]|nr:endo alpha-1,4 polygalactosaminidase [Planctomycetota bacterium]MCH9726588.1 endo alpha-1,4 polygalactosaminidase [Planctomycetota bacterium]MCH9779257.1 endo alpha-1,4 polygalactosaminidase [Planctomycetota bacterium]MCH9793392.1 endo alpha-1,4 polygalactosaminidase [Planctomycetota bacterium]
MLRYLNLFISLIFGLFLIQDTQLHSAEDTAFVASDFQLYYGGDNTLLDKLQHRMRKGQVVVIELRGLDQKQVSLLIKKAHQTGAKIIAYISIGELGQLEKDNFEAFLKRRKNAPALSKMVLSKNETFQSWHIDVSEKAWQDFLFQRINQIYQQNVDGLFLDTIDSIDLYINAQKWPIPRRAKSVSAMINLIRKIKAHSPDKFIMQNRGLNLIGKSVFVGDATGIFIPGLNLAKSHPNNPDGLLWETAYAHTGKWIEGKEREMIQIQKNGFTSVFTLGYSDTKANQKQFFEQSRAAGFIPAWASSSKKLHTELTQGITAK